MFLIKLARISSQKRTECLGKIKYTKFFNVHIFNITIISVTYTYFSLKGSICLTYSEFILCFCCQRVFVSCPHLLFSESFSLIANDIMQKLHLLYVIPNKVNILKLPRYLVWQDLLGLWIFCYRSHLNWISFIWPGRLLRWPEDPLFWLVSILFYRFAPP